MASVTAGTLVSPNTAVQDVAPPVFVNYETIVGITQARWCKIDPPETLFGDQHSAFDSDRRNQSLAYTGVAHPLSPQWDTTVHDAAALRSSLNLLEAQRSARESKVLDYHQFLRPLMTSSDAADATPEAEELSNAYCQFKRADSPEDAVRARQRVLEAREKVCTTDRRGVGPRVSPEEEIRQDTLKINGGAHIASSLVAHTAATALSQSRCDAAVQLKGALAAIEKGFQLKEETEALAKHQSAHLNHSVETKAEEQAGGVEQQSVSALSGTSIDPVTCWGGTLEYPDDDGAPLCYKPQSLYSALPDQRIGNYIHRTCLTTPGSFYPIRSGSGDNCRAAHENLQYGVRRSAVGAVYRGQFNGCLPDGLGVFEWPDGAVYRGEWRNGGRQGTGVGSAERHGNAVYYGEWLHDRKHGLGVTKFCNGNLSFNEYLIGEIRLPTDRK